MADEKWYCPRRAPYGMDQWRKPEEGDRWREDRWTEHPFPWSWTPRSCSFCGGLHPEDVLKLVYEGWEDEPALGKGYKGYLHPPGYTQSMTGALDKMDRGVDPIRALEERPSVRDPLPPAKIYAQHFTPAQLAELNEKRSSKPR